VTEAADSVASRRRAAVLLAYGMLTLSTWALLAPPTGLMDQPAFGWWVAAGLIPVFLVAALLVPSFAHAEVWAWD
jgi:hypothetical protein